MNESPLELWLDRFGAACPKCRAGIRSAPLGRCPSCQTPLVLILGMTRNNASAWFVGLIALSMSLALAMAPVGAVLVVLTLGGFGAANPGLGEIAVILGVFAAYLTALVLWLRLRAFYSRFPGWVAWVLAVSCCLPLLLLLALFLYGAR